MEAIPSSHVSVGLEDHTRRRRVSSPTRPPRRLSCPTGANPNALFEVRNGAADQRVPIVDTFEPDLPGPAFLLPGEKPGPTIGEPRQAAVVPRRLLDPWDHRSRE